jgi:O-antigen/teichoic acid export membrane protein
VTQHPDTPPSESHDTLGSAAFAGAAVMVGTRFAVRSLGLISVTFLARLLTPEDFGLFGTAAIVLTLFVILKEVGFSEAVIKQKTLTKADIDTLWTMRLILSLITSGAIFLVAPYAASFLKDPRVTDVLQLMALIPTIDAFASPASPLLLREFKYKTDFLLKSGNKIVQVSAVITVALILRSYWALVFGALLASGFSVITSHIIRPYRPRLSLERFANHRNFAAWSYLRSVSLYIANASDEFIIRSSASTAFFGIYHIARDLARVLIGDMIGPLREAMLPALSQMQDDPTRRAVAASNIFGAALIVGTAISLGIVVTAPELVALLLGDQWAAAAPYLSLLAIGCACNSIGEVNQSSFVIAGRQKTAALFWAARALSYGTACLVAGLLFGSTAIALTFSVMSVLFLAIETRYLFRLLKVKSRLVFVSARPIVSGVIMAFTIASLPLSATWPPIIIFAAKVGAGSIVYGLVLISLWKLNGFKEGPEHTLYSHLPAKIQKLIPLPIAPKNSAKGKT